MRQSLTKSRHWPSCEAANRLKASDAKRISSCSFCGTSIKLSGCKALRTSDGMAFKKKARSWILCFVRSCARMDKAWTCSALLSPTALHSISNSSGNELGSWSMICCADIPLLTIRFKPAK